MFFAWGPNLNVFERLRDEMNRLFDRRFFGHRMLPVWMAPERAFPRVNMTETTDALTVECELPGVGSDDVDISVEGGVLTVKGERKPPEGRVPERYYRRERGFGPFERSIELPSRVDVDSIGAKLSDGVLEIVLPKHPDSKPRRIEVKVK